MPTLNESCEDLPLITQALAGREEAYQELVTRHKRLVLGIVGRYGASPEDTDDLAQEVFLQAFRALPQYRHEAPFSHWLSRIAIRKSYEYLRRNKRQRLQVELEVAEERVDSRVPDARRASLIDWVRAALSQLKPKEQLVLSLLELQGYSVREVANHTGWTETNVKVRAHRARSALKEMLEKLDR